MRTWHRELKNHGKHDKAQSQFYETPRGDFSHLQFFELLEARPLAGRSWRFIISAKCDRLLNFSRYSEKRIHSDLGRTRGLN